MVRRLKIISGLILFVFVTVHLVNLAIGFFSLSLADQIRPVLLLPFSNRLGSVILVASATLHMVLGLHALYKRNTLKMSAHDTVQFFTALLIPLLLVPHSWVLIANQRLMGMDLSYFDMFHQYWIAEPLSGLRQVLLVLVIWIHGCIGLFTWLGLKSWWVPVSSYARLLAVVIPVAALLAFVEGGKQVILENSMNTTPGYKTSYNTGSYGRSGNVSAYGDQRNVADYDPYNESDGGGGGVESYGQSYGQTEESPVANGYGQGYDYGGSSADSSATQAYDYAGGSAGKSDQVQVAETRAFIEMVKWRIMYVYLVLLLIVLIARAFRVRSTGQIVEVHYSNGEVLRRPVGLNFLEIASSNDIAHANLCRGRGRCGTCRIRIIDSSDELDPPSDIERETLALTGSGDNVRLACQLTPGPGVFTIERLLPPNIQPHQLYTGKNITDIESSATVTENR